MEVLVSVTIFSFMMMGIYTIVDQGFKNKDLVTSEDKEILQVETALNRLGQDFSMIYSPLLMYPLEEKKKCKEGEDCDSQDDNPYAENKREKFPLTNKMGQLIPIVEGEDRGILSFMIYNNKRKMAEAKQSNFAWVRYAVETIDNIATEEESEGEKSNKSQTALVRYYYADNIYTNSHNRWDKIKKYVLLENVESIQFFFWSTKKEKFTDFFNELEKEEQLNLKAIQIKIVWIDKNGNKNNFERVYRTIWPYFDTKKDLEKKGADGNNSEEGEEDSTEDNNTSSEDNSDTTSEGGGGNDE